MISTQKETLTQKRPPALDRKIAQALRRRPELVSWPDRIKWAETFAQFIQSFIDAERPAAWADVPSAVWDNAHGAADVALGLAEADTPQIVYEAPRHSVRSSGPHVYVQIGRGPECAYSAQEVLGVLAQRIARANYREDHGLAGQLMEIRREVQNEVL